MQIHFQGRQIQIQTQNLYLSSCPITSISCAALSTKILLHSDLLLTLGKTLETERVLFNIMYILKQPIKSVQHYLYY